jgi:ribonucleoside-diphosphate reductase beta chain
MDENPELGSPKFTQSVYEACDLSVQLEFDFIDKAFEMGDIEGLSKAQLKNFIKERANQKLIELGYNRLYNDIDPNLIKQMDWFGHLTSGVSHTDFFSSKVTDYSKSTADWSDL